MIATSAGFRWFLEVFMCISLMIGHWMGPWVGRTDPALWLRGPGTEPQAVSGSTAKTEAFRLWRCGGVCLSPGLWGAGLPPDHGERGWSWARKPFRISGDIDRCVSCWVPGLAGLLTDCLEPVYGPLGISRCANRYVSCRVPVPVTLFVDCDWDRWDPSFRTLSESTV